MNYPFNVQWPKDNLFFTGYVHDILSYRYHWHNAEYELDIILRGKAEFTRGGKLYILEENDVILIDPTVGHASFALSEDTLALVVRFSVSAFKPFLKSNQTYSFDCLSNGETQNSPGFCRVRFFAAQIMQALFEGGQYSLLTAKASMEMLISTLCCYFSPAIVQILRTQDETHQEAIGNIMKYVEKNYASKITLEDLSRFSQYNRTYISTIFKNDVGVNFYEYLTRIRFQHAVHDLTATQKNLTEIAIDNGFPELKTFNARFKDTFQRTPARYRLMVSPDKVLPEYNKQNYYTMSEPIIQDKMTEYLCLSKN